MLTTRYHAQVDSCGRQAACSGRVSVACNAVACRGSETRRCHAQTSAPRVRSVLSSHPWAQVFDSGLIGEGVLHAVAAAQANLLQPDATLV